MYDNSCIWLFQINNCKESSILKNIVLSGIILNIFMLIILNIICFIYFKKNRLENIKFFETLLIGLIITFLIRSIYLILLYKEIEHFWILTLLQDTSWVFFTIMLNKLLLYISNLIPTNFYIKDFYKSKYLYLLFSFLYLNTTLFSILSGYYFKQNKKKYGYTFVGIQFLIWSIITFWLGFCCLQFMLKYRIIIYKNNTNNKINNALKKINFYVYMCLINWIIFPAIWLFQSIYMYFLENEKSILLIIISLFWYYLAILLVGICSVILLIINITYNEKENKSDFMILE